VLLESDPPGAQVLIDGTRIGKTPNRGAIERRTEDVTFVLRLPGYAEKKVTLPGNKPISERVKLVKPRDQGVNPFSKPGGP